MTGRSPLALALFVAMAGCGSRDRGSPADAGDEPAVLPPAPSAPVSAAPSASTPPLDEADAGRAPLVCPEGMLAIPAIEGRAEFCIDRWEASLVDRVTGQRLSPYYPPHQKLALRLRDRWEQERLTVGGPEARAMPLPPLPAFERESEPDPVAVSRPGVIPNGYLSGFDAERACTNAGKRLCRYEEWFDACQGKLRRPFPYGESYRPGGCNIFRARHPAAELHDDASSRHLDPRLNLVKDHGDPLLRPTGATESCQSEWEDGALFDMNGNIDEWVDDEKGRFVGGFYSRAKKDGCKSSVGAHPRGYFDYSTGARCCLSPS